MTGRVFVPDPGVRPAPRGRLLTSRGCTGSAAHSSLTTLVPLGFSLTEELAPWSWSWWL